MLQNGQSSTHQCIRVAFPRKWEGAGFLFHRYSEKPGGTEKSQAWSTRQSGSAKVGEPADAGVSRKTVFGRGVQQFKLWAVFSSPGTQSQLLCIFRVEIKVLVSTGFILVISFAFSNNVKPSLGPLLAVAVIDCWSTSPSVGSRWKLQLTPVDHGKLRTVWVSIYRKGPFGWFSVFLFGSFICWDRPSPELTRMLRPVFDFSS